MRYTKLRTWVIMLAVVVAIIFILTYTGGERGIYQNPSPVTDSLITAAYPDLYEAISQRDAQELEPFLSHQNEEVREQAWRAFANTPVDSLSTYIEMAKQQNSETSWFGISQQELTQNQLRTLEENWEVESSYRSGIARVLGQQGDIQSLDFLLERLETHDWESEYQFALAIGRLINRHGVSEGNEQIGVLQNAFEAENHETTRAYLYGWYRGDESGLTSTARDTLFSRWQIMGAGMSAEVDQYVNELLPERTTSNMTIFYNGEQRLDREPQLSVELAKSIEQIPLNDRTALAAKILLTNANSHVQTQTLQGLRGKISKGGNLYEYITGSMIPDTTLADPVWLQAVQTAADIDTNLVSNYSERLEDISSEHDYLLSDVLALYEQTETQDEYLQRIEQIVNNGEPLAAMQALQSLNRYWENNVDDIKSRIKQVREIVLNALERQDRGIAFTSQSLLQKDELFDSKDFDRINKTLAAFSLPGDIEVYQAFGSIYKAQYEQQAKPTIDSLAALNYGPLNRSLAQDGWAVEVPEESQSQFRLPNWERLWELGRNPVWTLRTEKGNISIELNTLSAPATISAIDSLSRAGVYDGIPLHRVVPNFVIQGGDIERQDGFGGPDFVLPTEASEKPFDPGAIGIASAGTDTEGSQYFLMHQWSPHLNGSYTRFGKVIDGTDVIHEITEGDRVLSTTWY